MGEGSTMDGPRLRMLGVGDGWPSLERNHSAFLYEFPDACVLVDCGESVSRGLRQAGVDWESIDAVLFSHFHADHIGGFFMLIQGLWLKRRRRALTVYLPRDGVEPLRQVLWAACLFDDLLPFELRFVPLEREVSFEISPVRVTPFATGHLKSLSQLVPNETQHRFEAFAFLIEHPSGRYAHSADVGGPGDLAPMFEQPVRHLLSELAHFEKQALIDFLRDVGRPNRLTLTHLTESLWLDREGVLATMNAALPGTEIQIPEDGTTVAL